jgi:predicted ATPase
VVGLVFFFIMKRIVLTGGPGSGKTVVSAAIGRWKPQKYIAVPEAATQVYSAAKTRWDLVDRVGQRELQRRIYHLQRGQEDAVEAAHPGKIVIFDRGTIDGAAYWPDGPENYWLDLKTTLEAELARYDMVIWMQTAAAIGIYDGAESNSVRFEDARGAVEAGEKLVKLWGSHGNFVRIEAKPTLEEKIAEVRGILDAMV